MKQIITTSPTLIFVMLAGAVHAGDCMRLCDNTFWKTRPTLDEVKAEVAKGADINGRWAGQTPLHHAAKYSRPEMIQAIPL